MTPWHHVHSGAADVDDGALHQLAWTRGAGALRTRWKLIGVGRRIVSERAMLSQIDAYVDGDGGWASGEVDPDEDDYPSSGGSDGDDFGADDY